jgi:glycerophosphoryl diester phosphodiesterase
MTPDGLTKIRTFATGLSPEKTIIRDHPDAMARARTMRMPITPYTFRSNAVAGFPDVRAEMAHFLRELGVDGVITDNPDMMPAIAGNR